MLKKTNAAYTQAAARSNATNDRQFQQQAICIICKYSRIRRTIMASRRFGLASYLVLSLYLCGLGLGHAEGASMAVFDSAGNQWNIGWSATAFPTLGFNISATGANNQTTGLTMTYTFTVVNPGPIVVTFTEVGVADTSYGGKAGAAAAGLNFNLLEVLLNDTNAPFGDLTETLKDFDLPGPVPGGTGTNGHPAQSHFHPATGLPPNTNPYDPFTTTNDFNTGQLLELTNGPMGVGAVSAINVKVHDIVVAGFQRNFTLTIASSPLAGVPEPPALILLLTGMIPLAGHFLRRKYGWPGRSGAGGCRDVERLD
jgi:hypothetical protein